MCVCVCVCVCAYVCLCKINVTRRPPSDNSSESFNRRLLISEFNEKGNLTFTSNHNHESNNQITDNIIIYTSYFLL